MNKLDVFTEIHNIVANVPLRFSVYWKVELKKQTKDLLKTATCDTFDHRASYLICPSPVQVALLDIHETAGESLTEALNQQHGAGKALFLKCDVESEEQIKGNAHLSNTRSLGNTGPRFRKKKGG